MSTRAPSAVQASSQRGQSIRTTQVSPEYRWYCVWTRERGRNRESGWKLANSWPRLKERIRREELGVLSKCAAPGGRFSVSLIVLIVQLCNTRSCSGAGGGDPVAVLLPPLVWRVVLFMAVSRCTLGVVPDQR